MARKEFPTAVKAAAMKRCMEPNGVPKCEKCGIQIKGRYFAFDHVNPDGLTGEPILSNCQVLCSGFTESCHDNKTRQDTSDIARAKRREAKSLGIRKPSKWPCGRQSSFKKTFSGTVVPRESK